MSSHIRPSVNPRIAACRSGGSDQPPRPRPSQAPGRSATQSDGRNRSRSRNKDKTSAFAQRRDEQLVQHAVDNAVHPEASHDLAFKLRYPSEGYRDAIFDVLLPEAARLSMDACGNHIIQLLFEKGSSEQRQALLETLGSSVVRLSQHKYASRVVQKAVQCIDESSQISLAEDLMEHLTDLTEHEYGHRVLQVWVQHMPAEFLDVVITELDETVESTTRHPHGWQVLQNLIKRCESMNQLDRLDHVLQQIVAATKELSLHIHGNHIVQCVLQHGRLVDRQGIVAIVCSCFHELATRNGSSHAVAELCIRIVSADKNAEELVEERRILLEAILGHELDSTPLKELAEYQYGRHVLQTLVKNCCSADKHVVRSRLQSVAPHLAGQFGQQLLTSMQKCFNVESRPRQDTPQSPISLPCVTLWVDQATPVFLAGSAEGQRIHEYCAGAQERKDAAHARQEAGELEEGEDPSEVLSSPHISVAVACMKALALDPNCPNGCHEQIDNFLAEKTERQMRSEIRMFRLQKPSKFMPVGKKGTTGKPLGMMIFCMRDAVLQQTLVNALKALGAEQKSETLLDVGSDRASSCVEQSLGAACSVNANRVQQQDAKEHLVAEHKSRSQSPRSLSSVSFLVDPARTLLSQGFAEGQRFQEVIEERKRAKAARRARHEAGETAEREEPPEAFKGPHILVALASLKALALDSDCPGHCRDEIEQFLTETPEEELTSEIQMFRLKKPPKHMQNKTNKTGKPAKGYSKMVAKGWGSITFNMRNPAFQQTLIQALEALGAERSGGAGP